MRAFLIVLLFLIGQTSFAKVWLPTILSDNMVLQQQSNATIWGWTTHTIEDISISGSWNNSVITVKAHQGVWYAQLPTPEAGGPYTLTIKGHETIVLENILIGEVWLCSGQSNMQWSPDRGLLNADEEIKKANYPNIRFFQVPQHKSEYPQKDMPGEWMTCTPETMRKFSSVGYLFGRQLHESLDVPIGLINSSWGGSNIEPWIKKEIIENIPELSLEIEKMTKNKWLPNKRPGFIYNAMIHPIINFDIAGAIWYQGESNRDNAMSYYKSFPLLIESWRKDWGKEFPFYFVQIAPFNYGSEENIKAAIVRDAQWYTMNAVENTGMVVTNDIGNLNNIHPINKQEVGRRLSLWALAKTYGVKNIKFSGPTYKSMKVKRNKIIIDFNFSDDGLMQIGKELQEFYMAGEDQVFFSAKAKIVGNTVVVSSSKVKNPKAVRFAFSETALPNLFNKAGLPAAAFRTDNWKLVTD